MYCKANALIITLHSTTALPNDLKPAIMHLLLLFVVITALYSYCTVTLSNAT